MNKAAINQMVDLLTKIRKEPDKNIYEITNPLSMSGAFVEIIVRSIFSNHYKLNSYKISFESCENMDMSDGIIWINVNTDPTTCNVTVLVESCKDTIHKLTRSALDISVDIANKEYCYNISQDDTTITIEW